MSVTAKPLVNSKFASNTTTTEYTTPANTKTILDKFTLTNTSGSSATVSIYIVPSGQSAATSNQIVKDQSVAAGAISDLSQLQNQILTAGDFISVVASSASAVVIRVSGREVA